MINLQLEGSLTEHHAPSLRVGIVDIGSNSIRFVVYDQLKRSPVPLYNEKVMCQLGKGLAASGRLNPNGVESARETIRRFLVLARNMEVASLYVMATAAVRDATDGPAFAYALEQEHSITVDIISGEKEAQLSAYGICASIHQPHGITGDLGGGSMELVHLEDNEQLEHITLPIGPLRLIDETKGSRSELRKSLDRVFEDLSWLKSVKAKEFYAIGGSFRAIGKLHMELEDYPLRILHQYTVSAKSLAAFVEDLAGMSDEKLEKLPGLSSKRIPAITPAVMIMQRIIETVGPDRVIFSASGIREGYLYEKLSPYMRKQDALIASCTEIADRGNAFSMYAGELMTWMHPLLEARESDDERRLRLAFCLLSDIAHHIHPEHRAEWAMQRILCSAFTSITHRERVQLALALYYRYQFKLKKEPPEMKLVNERGKQWARLVGSCANLAYHLTGSIPGHLHQTMLGIDKKDLTLAFSREAQDLMGEAVARRITGVDEAWRKWSG